MREFVVDFGEMIMVELMRGDVVLIQASQSDKNGGKSEFQSNYFGQNYLPYGRVGCKLVGSLVQVVV